MPSFTLGICKLLMSTTNYSYAYITALPHALAPVWGHGDLPKVRPRLSLLSLSCYDPMRKARVSSDSLILL